MILDISFHLSSDNFIPLIFPLYHKEITSYWCIEVSCITDWKTGSELKYQQIFNIKNTFSFMQILLIGSMCISSPAFPLIMIQKSGKYTKSKASRLYIKIHISGPIVNVISQKYNKVKNIHPILSNYCGQIVLQCSPNLILSKSN